MSAALDLVVLTGPLEGQVVQLRPNEPLLLGRSSKGLQLIDPLVSLNHSEITWEGDRYWIEDLSSATGTYVNDVRLLDKAVCLVPGMRIRMGETDLEVRERPRSAALRIVGAAAALLILYLGVRSFMDSIEVSYDPKIRWATVVNQGAGFQSDVLEIPTSFIRESGVDHRELQVERVTDFDANGVDELWLRWPGGRRVVTFNPDGSWKNISDLNADCLDKSRSLEEGLPAECYVDKSRVRSEMPQICRGFDLSDGFPDQDCAGTTLRFNDGGYHIVEHAGLYAWMPPTKEVELPLLAKAKGKVTGTPLTKRVVTEGPIEPFLFTLIRPSNLAGFLADRGVVEPVHYLVCEDAVPGVRAQVLTESGEIVPLTVGCIGDLKAEGLTYNAEFGDGLPRMLAFTGVGYEALLEDVAVYMGGGIDKLFMDRGQLAAYDKLSAAPQRRLGSMRIAFEGPVRIFDPIAEEVEVAEGRRLLASEFAAPPPPISRVVRIDGPGRYPMEGCSELEVTTNDWHCLFTKACGANSKFLTIHNIGCGEAAPARYPYARALSPYMDDHIEGRVSVESIDVDGQIDVLRVRMAYRERVEPPAAPADPTAKP